MVGSCGSARSRSIGAGTGTTVRQKHPGQGSGNKFVIQVSFISIWLLVSILAHHAPNMLL